MRSKLVRRARQSLTGPTCRMTAKAIYEHRFAAGARLRTDHRDRCRQLDMSAPAREPRARAAALERVCPERTRVSRGAAAGPGEIRRLFAVRHAVELEALPEIGAPPGPGLANRAAPVPARSVQFSGGNNEACT